MLSSDDCVMTSGSDEYDVKIVADRLTDDQRHCILNLNEDWTTKGYSKVTADLLWATDSKFFPDRFGPLVDCRYHRESGICPDYHHRLLPLGVKVKSYLQRAQ